MNLILSLKIRSIVETIQEGHFDDKMIKYSFMIKCGERNRIHIFCPLQTNFLNSVHSIHEANVKLHCIIIKFSKSITVLSYLQNKH